MLAVLLCGGFGLLRRFLRGSRLRGVRGLLHRLRAGGHGLLYALQQVLRAVAQTARNGRSLLSHISGKRRASVRHRVARFIQRVSGVVQRPFQLHGIHARFLGSACHHFLYLCARVAQHAARRAGNILQHAARGYVLRLGPGETGHYRLAMRGKQPGPYIGVVTVSDATESGARRYAKAQQAF